MHIKDYNDAMKFFRTYDSVASKGKWKEFVDEMEFDSMAHEPRNMANGGNVYDKKPKLPQLKLYADRLRTYVKAGAIKKDYATQLLQEKMEELGVSDAELGTITGRRGEADGGRIGLSDGQLVRPTVDGSRPGYNGMKPIHLGDGIYENTSKVTGKKTWFGKVQRKNKLLKSPHGTEADAIKFVTEKRKLPKAKSVIELQSEKGTLLDQPKYKKALENALDDLAKMETKGYGAINEIVKKYQNMFSRVGEKTVQGKIIEKGITTESRAITNAIRSYAAENNIRDVQIKEMEKALDNYTAKKIPERGYIPKLMKKHGIPEATFNSWLIELDARRKIPKKYKSESERIKATRDKRSAALKKYSSPGFEKWTKGTAESGLQGGHTGQIYSEEVTPKTKKFTPKKINQETLKRYDSALQGIADKRDKAFKAKNWAEVERLNQKGMEYASATEGYKTFTIKNRDGTKFEWGSTTKGAIDPMDLTKEGITAKEMESWRMGKNPEIVKAKKLLDKKLISPADFETIRATEEAKLFAEGKNKALLDFQKPEAMISAKMSKKEITALDKRLRSNLIKLGCGMYAGGRVGFKVGSGKCINRAVAKLKSGNLSAAEKKIVDAMGDGLKKGGKPKKFWTTVLKGEGYLALADFANNLTKGQSLDKSFSNAVETATLGALDIGGNERDLMRYAKERGLDTKDMKEWMDYAETYGKYTKAHEDQQYAHETLVSDEISMPEDIDLQQSVLDQSPDRIKKLEGQLEEQGKAESIQSGKGYRDLNEMIEGVVAKEWNKPAGTALDRGYRKMLGMKGDEGLVWGPVGTLFREGAEKLGFEEHKALKSFKPQKVMNYHPAYGYKEDIKDVIREGDSPMEDMLEFMKKFYPRSALNVEAARDKLGTYDYDPNLYATGGIASLMKKKW